MSNIVLLTPKKTLVRIKTSEYELTNKEIDTSGMLSGFYVGGTRYIFIDKDDYLIEDQEKDNLLVGFVKYESYIEYASSSQKDIYNYNYIINPVCWFDVNLKSAEIGDLFKISKLETSPSMTSNYTKYFVYYKCEFKINNFDIDFTDSSQYPAINLNESSATYCKVHSDDKSSNLIDTAQSKFFRKNLGSKIASLPPSVNDAAKKVLYAGLIKICWRISNMFKDALDKIAIKDLSYIYNIVITTNLPAGVDIKTYINSRPDLTDIDKVIAALLVDWGYRDYEDTIELFPLNIEQDQFYGGYYTPFQNYYNTLVNVYINLAYSREAYLFGATTDPSTWNTEYTKKQSDLRLQVLVSIIPDGSINFLDFETKIKILRKFAENSIYEAREDAVIKIVKSIQVNQALNFLNRLRSEALLIDNKSITLFEALYNKINDKIFLFGKNNRREFVNRLYNLWYVSTHNPYNILDMSITNNNPNTARDHYNNLYKNKPVVLNYDSKKFFGFFVDNMNFEFNFNNISVHEEKEVGFNVAAGGEVIPKKEFVKIGDYNFYSAISIKEFKENDTAVKLPAISLEGTANNKSHIIPLFYLKYLDDFGDNEDLWTAIGLTIDIALTFTGIGNISKLRHFRHLSKLGRVALKDSTLAASERILALEALSGVSGLVELTSSVASMILQYYTAGCNVYIDAVKVNINDNTPEGQVPTNPAYNWCRNLDQFLFWVQLASAGTDFISSYMVRKSARKMLDDGIPNDFLNLTDPETGVKAYDIVLKFAGNLDEMKSTFFHKIQNLVGSNTKLENDVKNLLNSSEQHQFIVDFGKSETKILQELNSNYSNSLVNEWKAITFLKNERKGVNFLKQYRLLMSQNRILTHIHSGHSGVKPSGKAWVTGGHNPDLLELTDTQGNQVWRWANEVNPNNPQHVTFKNGYAHGRIERRIDGWTGGNPPTSYRKKDDMTTMWKKFHNDPTLNRQRINEEMANALSNRKYVRSYSKTRGGIVIKKDIYVGKATDGMTIEIVFEHGSTTNLNSIYPNFIDY